MRDALLMVIVGTLGFAGIINPRIGLFGYVWFALMRPDVLAWVYGKTHYSLILAVTTLIGSVVYVPTRLMTLLRNPISLGLIALVLWESLSVVTAYQTPLAIEPYLLYVRVVAVAFAILLLIDRLVYLRWLLVVMGMSLGLLGSKFGLFGIAVGGARFMEGYGGLMADNNTMALAFAMGVPLCLYSMWLIPWKIFRVGLLAMLVANVAAIVMTYSRGAAVALAAGALVLILHTKRRVWVLATMALLAIPPVLLVKDTYLQRLSTLKDPTAEGSAYSRIVLAKVSLKMAADYPVFGVGFGRTNQQALIYRYLPSDVATDRYGIKVLHNTYAQTMVDSGIPALLLHCALLFGTIGWLEVSYRRIRVTHPTLTAYPLAIQNALVVFAVGSTFLSRVEFDLYYFLLMAAAVWWEQERKLPLSTPVIQPLTLRQSVAPKPAVIGPAHRALPQIWQSLAPDRARRAKR